MRHLALLLTILVAPVAARASDPLAVYTVPTRVDFLPAEANADKVVLHGACFFRQKDGRHGDPACGQMYFACKAGQEAMCRMQWHEIKKNIGADWCTAFGDSEMVTTATLRPEVRRS